MALRLSRRWKADLNSEGGEIMETAIEADILASLRRRGLG